jgi:hypothetical protein
VEDGDEKEKSFDREESVSTDASSYYSLTPESTNHNERKRVPTDPTDPERPFHPRFETSNNNSSSSSNTTAAAIQTH